MPCVVSAEVVVNFLKLRNIDLLQQGLYRVSVGVRGENSKEGAVPISISKNDPSGRKALWQDRPHPTFPASSLNATERRITTHTFFVRFQEQVEVLDELAVFRLEMDALQACKPWGDSAVVTFELWHCPKEDYDKMPTVRYERELEDGTWESYSDSACASISKGKAKAKTSIAFKHHGVRFTLELDGKKMREAPSAESKEGRQVREVPRTVPNSAFTKVATREIPVRNILLPHTEWVPVMWHEWFAASCQVLIHTCVVHFDYRPPVTEGSPYLVTGDATGAAPYRGFAALAQQECGSTSDTSLLGCASRMYALIASYLVYATYFVMAWKKRYRTLKNACVHTHPNQQRGTLEKLKERLMGSFHERFCDLSSLRNRIARDQCGKGRGGERDKEAVFDPCALMTAMDVPVVPQGDDRPEDLLEDLLHPDQGGVIPLSSAPLDSAQNSPGSTGLDEDMRGPLAGMQGRNSLRATQKVDVFVQCTEPSTAVPLSQSEDGMPPLLVDPRAGQDRCLMPWVNTGLAHTCDDAEEACQATRVVVDHLVKQFVEMAGDLPDNDSVAQVFLEMTSQHSSELRVQWQHLVDEVLVNGVGAMMFSAKRLFWRSEALRARKCITVLPDRQSPQPLTLSPQIKAAVPPFIPLTFTYPQHTFVEFQVLSSGVPRGDGRGELLSKYKGGSPPPHPSLHPPSHPSGHPDTHRGVHPSTSHKNCSTAHLTGEGWSDDDQEHAAVQPEALLQKLRNRSEGHHDKHHHGGGKVHLIVFVHGYKGNQYDLRGLRNHMALTMPVGVEFLVAKSVEDHSDDGLLVLGELLAKEVSQHVRDENIKLNRLSFIGHSMGCIVIRAALQHKQMEPFLPLLYTYVSLSGPHLGVADSDCVRVSGALWVLSNLKQSTNIQQLRLDQPCLHSLSCTDKIGLFSHVLLLASDDDKYVTLQSATLDPNTKSSLCKNPKKAALVEDMLRNLSMHLSLCDTVLRFNIRFHPIGRAELSTAMERAVGKSVHVAFLSNPDFIHCFVCLFRPYFS